jgi:spermidine synthase
MRLQERLWNPYILVFLSSSCIMILEVVASRIIAPRVGVSIHTWTAVIGVVLAGISLGNYIGGRLADWRPTWGTLGSLFTLGSLSFLAVLWLNNDLHEFTISGDVPMMAWILGYVGGVFFLPSVILGCISPIVVKRTLQRLTETGSVVGRIYASSVAGSIFGTFAAGFWLISNLGTKNTILVASTLLMTLGLWFLSIGPWQRVLLRVAMALTLFSGSAWLLQNHGFLESECLMETHYYCINVNTVEMDGREVQEMLLDRLVHSYNNIEDPTHLVYDYARTYVGLMAPWAESNPELSLFFVGGGGYTVPRSVEATWPEMEIVVSEIDPGVTLVAQQYMGLDPNSAIRTYNADARNVLTWEMAPDSYDIIFGDAFSDYSIPYHLTTLEFTQLVDRALRDDGLYLANVIDGGIHGHFLRAYVHTLREVFGHVIVIPSHQAWRNTVRGTFVIAASHRPIDVRGLAGEYSPLSQGELNDYLAMEPPLVLTDDYVPVDNLMAPVAEDSFFIVELSPDMISRIVPRIVAVGIAGGVIFLAVVALIVYRWLSRRERRLQAEGHAQGE